MIELKNTQLELAIGHFFELVVKAGKSSTLVDATLRRIKQLG